MPLFIFPHRDQALLLKPIFVVFTSFTIGIKNVILFDPENVSSRLYFKPQSGKLSCGNHSAFIYEWKENDPIENGRRRPFACGIQEIYKSHVDLCVRDREAFWSLTSCP